MSMLKVLRNQKCALNNITLFAVAIKKKNRNYLYITVSVRARCLHMTSVPTIPSILRAFIIKELGLKTNEDHMGFFYSLCLFSMPLSVFIYSILCLCGLSVVFIHLVPKRVFNTVFW